MTLRKYIAAMLAAVCLFSLFGCVSGHSDAVLHTPGDNGYIAVSATPIDVRVLSGQAFVYDVESGQYLYLKGESRVLFPASTTKLLTILYALTLLSPEVTVTPGNELELVAEDASIAYIKSYHALTVEMLIEGMLLPSGNDAAYVLAAAAGRTLAEEGTVPDGKQAVTLFVEGMNRYAAEIGLCGSVFLSPDGYYAEGHYSTLEDMTIIARLAAKNSIIMHYAGLAEDDVTYASGHTNHWENTNLLLCPGSPYYSPYVTGLKTGSAGRGNYSVLVTASVSGREYIIGVFSSADRNQRFADVLTILDVLGAE